MMFVKFSAASEIINLYIAFLYLITLYSLRNTFFYKPQVMAKTNHKNLFIL